MYNIAFKQKENEFRNRCMKIYNDLRSSFDKDKEYLSSSGIIQYPTGEVYVIRGRHFDILGKFNHEPSDEEIKRVICMGMGISYPR